MLSLLASGNAQDFKNWLLSSRQHTAQQKQIRSMFDGADFLVREKAHKYTAAICDLISGCDQCHRAMESRGRDGE